MSYKKLAKQIVRASYETLQKFRPRNPFHMIANESSKLPFCDRRAYSCVEWVTCTEKMANVMYWTVESDCSIDTRPTIRTKPEISILLKKTNEINKDTQIGYSCNLQN